MISIAAIERSSAESIIDSWFSLNNGQDALYGLCKFNTVKRDVLNITEQWLESENHEMITLTENAVTCDDITGKDWFGAVTNLTNGIKENMTLHQIIIRNSEPKIVPHIIDALCENRYFCNQLTVFNISNHKWFDDIAKWVKGWRSLEVLDLTNTSVTSIESIFQDDSEAIKRNPLLNPEPEPIPMPPHPRFGRMPNPKANPKPIPAEDFTFPRFVNMTELLLDHNNLTELNFHYISEKMFRLRILSVRNNSIYDIFYDDYHTYMLEAVYLQFRLAHNAINCERTQTSLIRSIFNEEYKAKYPEKFKIQCGEPGPYAKMDWHQRLSIFNSELCDLCWCRDHPPGPGQGYLPQVYVDCHYRTMTELPPKLPFNAKAVDLTGNMLESLWLPAEIENWETVLNLIVSDNFLADVSQNLRQNLPRWQNLWSIDLRKNRINGLDLDVLDSLKEVHEVHISDNPWTCSCENIRAFQEWLQKNYAKLRDEEDVRCGTMGGELNGYNSYDRSSQKNAGDVVIRIAGKDICLISVFMDPFEFLDLLNIFLSFTALGATVKALLDLAFKYRTGKMPKWDSLNF